MYGNAESKVRLRIGLLEDPQRWTLKRVICALLVFMAKQFMLFVLYSATDTVMVQGTDRWCVRVCMRCA